MSNGWQVSLTVQLVCLGFALWGSPGHSATLTLTWTDNSVDEEGFAVDRKVGVLGPYATVARVGADATSYIDTDVIDGTAYCYRIRAFSAAEFSEYTNEACAIAGQPGVPVPPGLALMASPDRLLPGGTLEFVIEVANPGPDIVVDVYFLIVLPAQLGPEFGCAADVPVVSLTAPLGSGAVPACLSTLPLGLQTLDAGVRIPPQLPAVTLPNVLRLALPVTAPSGDYGFFMLLTRSGAFQDGTVRPGDVIAITGQTVTYAP
jgi:hypothetical protein